jgi:hypothetical protein
MEAPLPAPQVPAPLPAVLCATFLQVTAPSIFKLICCFDLIWCENFELIQTLGGEIVVQSRVGPNDHETTTYKQNTSQMDVPKLPELCCFFIEYRLVLTMFKNSFGSVKWNHMTYHGSVKLNHVYVVFY